MKRESVIISSFNIERTNQIKLFQVRIPREAKNIIGVEMGMRWLVGAVPPPTSVPGPPPGPVSWPPPLPVGGLQTILRRNQLVGELKLQSYEKANIFYTGELVLDQNIDNRDFTHPRFANKVYSHGLAMHEDPVSVNGDTTLVQGVFRNRLPVVGNFQFRVFVYIWTEAKVDQSNL